MISLGSDSSPCASRPSVLQKLANLRLYIEKQPGEKSRDSRRFPVEQKKGDTTTEELLLQSMEATTGFPSSEAKAGSEFQKYPGAVGMQGV